MEKIGAFYFYFSRNNFITYIIEDFTVILKHNIFFNFSERNYIYLINIYYILRR